MHSRWILKSFVLAAALMLTLPVVAFAQTSRVEGMALQGDYIKDYTGIYTYPSCLPIVGNLVYAELGNNLFDPATGHPITQDRSLGVVMDKLFDGKLGVWGIHLRQETPQLGQGDAFSHTGAGFGQDPNSNTNESFDLMWGKKAGGTSIGLRLNRSFSKFEGTIPGATTTLEFDIPGAAVNGSENLARNIFGFGAGVGFELSSNSSLELSVLYQTRTFENTTAPPTTGIQDDGGATYMFAARMFWGWQPNVIVVPVFKWYSFDLSEKTVGGVPTTFDNSLKGWQLGVAGNWTLGTNDLLVLGVTFAQNKIEQEEDLFGLSAAAGMSPTLNATETLMPQVFGALETHVNHWLTLRVGANKGAFQEIKLEDQGAPNATQTFSFSSFNMNIGAGVKLGTIQLDAILSNDFPQNMGWIGSGIAKPYFPKVTATYAF